MPCKTSFVKININKIKPFIYFLTILLSINFVHAIDCENTTQVITNKYLLGSPTNNQEVIIAFPF